MPNIVKLEGHYYLLTVDMVDLEYELYELCKSQLCCA